MTPPTDPDCEFCRIVLDLEPAREVFRTSSVLAFFPLKPATLGHTLLVPTEHMPDIWALTEQVAADLAHWTLSLASAVRRVMRPDGLNVIQSNGSAASQTVPHLHVHIVPRWQGDAIGQIWPPESHYSETQKDQAWEALREEFSHGSG